MKMMMVMMMKKVMIKKLKWSTLVPMWLGKMQFWNERG